MVEAERQQEVLEVASELFSRNPGWVEFYREILGLRGLVRQRFSDAAALREFKKSEVYWQIQTMLRQLRERPALKGGVVVLADQSPTMASVPVSPVADSEPTQVITVRLPRSLHDALRVEAHEHCTSINKLCISKLLQFIDAALVPSERTSGDGGEAAGSA